MSRKQLTRQNITDVLHLIHESVLDYRDGAQEVAKAIQRPYSTLMRELNPNDAGAKLGVTEWLAVMDVTGNLEALRRTALLFGYRLEPDSPSTGA